MIRDRVVTQANVDLLLPLWNITCCVDDRVKKCLVECAKWLAKVGVIRFDLVSKCLVFQTSEAAGPAAAQRAASNESGGLRISFCKPYRSAPMELKPEDCPKEARCVSFGRRLDPVEIFAQGELSLQDTGMVAFVKYALEFEFRSEKVPIPIDIVAWHEFREMAAPTHAQKNKRTDGFAGARGHPTSRDITSDQDADVLVDLTTFRYSERICVPFFLSSRFPVLGFRLKFTGASSVVLLKVRLLVLSTTVESEDLKDDMSAGAISMQSTNRNASSAAAPHASRVSTPSLKTIHGIESVPIPPDPQRINPAPRTMTSTGSRSSTKPPLVEPAGSRPLSAPARFVVQKTGSSPEQQQQPVKEIAAADKEAVSSEVVKRTAPGISMVSAGENDPWWLFAGTVTQKLLEHFVAFK
eukprot:ANDGO_02093.mRNA.2 hypothetical protein